MSKELFSNIGKYICFMLKREKVNIIIWIVAIFFITVGQAQSFVELYPTQEERQIVAESMENPAMVALMGEAYGKENYTLGALMSQQTLLFTIIAVAIMNILLINRNLRADEESGKVEMIRAAATGRLVNIGASLVICVCINVCLGVLISVGLFSLKIESMDLNGSMMYGMALAVSGMLFGAITAIMNQIFSGSRKSLGSSFVILGIAYLVRAIGDIGNAEVSMVSPLGWIMRTQVYVENNLWPVMISLVVTAMLFCAALMLNLKRDLGAGVFQEKRGRESATIFLKGPFGLASRIMRGEYIAWIFAIIILGLSFGSMLGEIEKQLQTNEMMMQIFTLGKDDGMLDQFITVIMSIAAMLSTIPVVSTIIRLKSEENANRLDNVISKAVSRNRLVTGFFANGLIVSVLLQVLFAVAFWLAGKQVVNEQNFELCEILKSSLVYLPAIWIMLGVTLLLVGWFPKLTVGVWIYYAYSFFVIYLGGMLKLEQWTQKISPYGNVPNILIDNINYNTIFIMVLIFISLTTVGYVGYNRRDLQA